MDEVRPQGSDNPDPEWLSGVERNDAVRPAEC